MTSPAPLLSVVIPLYGSEHSIERVAREIAALPVDGGLELVLVNDGSPDDTLSACQRILSACAVPVTVVDLARNFGEHNAVLAGLRAARGQWVVTMDDDGQNPPAEVLALLAAARTGGHDVVFGRYAVKRHAPWRNWGSRVMGWIAHWVLDKPPGLYLSSFRCLSRFIVDEITRYEGPHPYIDGLVLQSTSHIASVTVEHRPRQGGRSRYTLRKLARLWLRLLVNFSIRPLRIATVVGLAMGALGLAGIVWVGILYLTNRGPAFGWGSLIAALLLFSGTQMVMLGLIGEYLGRIHLNINRRPQAVVRQVWRGGHADR